MGRTSSHSLRLLLEAAEILHSRAEGSFHTRVFHASRLLFADSVHSFEMFRLSGGEHTAQTDIPFSSARLPEILKRLAELVPKDHPLFPRVMRGERNVMRLSDFITRRRLRGTDLYNEIMREAGVEYQMVIPASLPGCAGGLTVNRGTADYSGGEMAEAVIFARHLTLAFETDQLLRAAAPQRVKAERAVFIPLRRLGLSRRECEVLWWIGQGKRDRETAVILGLSLRTIHHHAAAVLRKLGVESRTAAVCLLHRLCGPEA